MINLVNCPLQMDLHSPWSYNGRIFLDSSLLLEEEMMSIAWSAYYPPRLLFQLYLFQNKDCLVTVIHALVTSNLDHYNALHTGLLGIIQKLQPVQNVMSKLLIVHFSSVQTFTSYYFAIESSQVQDINFYISSSIAWGHVIWNKLLYIFLSTPDFAEYCLIMM